MAKRNKKCRVVVDDKIGNHCEYCQDFWNPNEEVHNCLGMKMKLKYLSAVVRIQKLEKAIATLLINRE